MDRIQRFNSLVAMASIFALVCPLVAPTPALAKTPKAVSLGWDNVLRMRHGEVVAVTLFSKKVYAGKVESVEPNAISVSLQKKLGSVLIPREEIRSVVRDEHVKAIEIGSIAVGAGALLAASSNLVGTVQQGSCLNNNPTTITGLDNCSNINHTALEGAGFSLVGAGLVVAILIGKPKYIYQADTPPQADMGQMK
jgi:hypothetical protein